MTTRCPRSPAPRWGRLEPRDHLRRSRRGGSMSDEDRGPGWPSEQQQPGSVWPAPMPGTPPPPMPTQVSAAGTGGAKRSTSGKKATAKRKAAPKRKATAKRKTAPKQRATAKKRTTGKKKTSARKKTAKKKTRR